MPEKKKVPEWTLLFGWVAYFALYYLTERCIPAERCHPVHIFLDDWIPFCAWFVIPYVLWYGMIVFSLGYFFCHNRERFRQLQLYFIIVQLLASCVYILWPTRQDLRPEGVMDGGALSRCVGLLYSLDTNTGVCPSLHVALSLGMVSVWTKEKSVRRVWKAFWVAAGAAVCLSTVFIKQHSAADVLAAIPVALAAEIIVYRKEIKNKWK